MIVKRKLFSVMMDDMHKSRVLGNAKREGRARKNLLTGGGAAIGGIIGGIGGTIAGRDPAVGLVTGIAGAGIGAYLGRKKGKKAEKSVIDNVEKELEFYNKLSDRDKKELRQEYQANQRAARQEHLLRSQNRKLRHIRRNQLLFL